ncbi:MAG TPA: hypothetical protein O0X19_00265 [Methanocorpusculum sp.]|nr:hypothetical protein [Candidatus Methanocorpusculum equi]MCQ2357325.1 hypothetical protein [Methanocorpusculum sp.]HJJ32806.1 hypothetical protein [Methanocorpusculum sp.]HJJ44150.1 hypothetical protein [Methanocorpusculum sp.]HJJ58793.1 hypothetical protein [Methanocorpusculum sp.]
MQVFDNVNLFNPADSSWELSSFSVEDGKVALIGPSGSIPGKTAQISEANG